MKLKSHIEEEVKGFIFQFGYGHTDHSTNEPVFIPDARTKAMVDSLRQSLKSIAYKSKEDAFDVLMSCMPKSAENINTITPEDARKMLQDFVKKYWQEKEHKDEI